MAIEKKKYCVGGVWKESKTDKWMDVTDSSTGEVIAQVPCCTKEEVEEAIAAADAAFVEWSGCSPQSLFPAQCCGVSLWSVLLPQPASGFWPAHCSRFRKSH